jgi:hypothetical protein
MKSMLNIEQVNGRLNRAAPVSVLKTDGTSKQRMEIDTTSLPPLFVTFDEK